MSVLIMGVHKSNCIGCICTNDNANYCWAAKRHIPMEGEPEFCPMVELPDHGDLIDRDALMTRLGMAMDCEGCPNRTALYFCGLPREVMEVCDELEKAPVVIPAERSEDGET